MAEEEDQRTIAGEDDDDDDEEKESETETDGEELEGDESEPDESAGPSKGEQAGGTLLASSCANPSIPIPVLSPDRDPTNPNSSQGQRDGDGRGNGNGKVEVVEPVSSLSPSLGESQRRAEREESMAAASRRLFQRLWTDEEEIRILRGFLEFTRRRGTTFASHQYDTGPFYEEIRQQLHLDFSKNQLIEKLRRLKKKYRNCAARMRSKGPSFSFRSPHEQAIFDIARHIWRPANKRQGQTDSSHVDLDLAVDHPSASAPSDELDFSFSFASFPAPSAAAHTDLHLDSDPAKPHSRSSSRRGRRRFQQETFPPPPPPLPTVTAAIPVSVSPPAHPEAAAVAAVASLVPPPIVPSVSSGAAMEEVIRSCLSPLFKELVSSAIGGGASSVGLSGLGPMPTCQPGKISDDKWRQQHILELEVYLQRIELVKEQVMQALQDLKGTNT